MEYEHKHKILEEAIDTNNLAIREEFVSLSAMNPFSNHNSAPRGTMMLGQFSQLVALINPKPKIIQTGIEAQLSENTFKCLVEKDCIVKAIITTNDNYNIQDTEIIYLIAPRATLFPFKNRFLHKYRVIMCYLINIKNPLQKCKGIFSVLRWFKSNDCF